MTWAVSVEPCQQCSSQFGVGVRHPRIHARPAAMREAIDLCRRPPTGPPPTSPPTTVGTHSIRRTVHRVQWSTPSRSAASLVQCQLHDACIRCYGFPILGQILTGIIRLR
jgi:hypothetical protein